MRRATPHPAPATDRPAVLTKATLHAAHLLGVTNKVLANVLGLSEATISRMQNGKYTLDPEDKSFELAVLFVRLYRSLDAIVGGDDAVAAAWLRNRNTALERQPVALIQSASGLMNAIAYLDARRALV
jgi:antitoxin Xre/MbcA/ParS-like protein